MLFHFVGCLCYPQSKHEGTLAALEQMLMAVCMQGGFPVQLTALGELRELELTSVGPGAFVTLPNSITNWQELRDLQLYRCGLEKLPECISALSKLDSLLMEGFRSVYWIKLCGPGNMLHSMLFAGNFASTSCHMAYSTRKQNIVC